MEVGKKLLSGQVRCLCSKNGEENWLHYQNITFMVLSQVKKFSLTISQRCPLNDVDISLPFPDN